jgi:hypothetical protein
MSAHVSIEGVGWCDGVERGENISSVPLEDTLWLVAGDSCAVVGCCWVFLSENVVDEVVPMAQRQEVMVGDS